MARVEVVQRLLKVFRQHGYEGATLSRISEATGLGRASLCHHFLNELDPEQARKRAEDAVMQIQGALVLKRALGDTALSDRVLQQLPVKLMDVSL